MALNSLTTDLDSLIINDVGIVVASMGMIGVLIILGIILHHRRHHRQRVDSALRSLPTKLLYYSILLSLLFSISWIISCSPSATNRAACNFAMWGIVFSTHLINGLLLAILLHCGLLLSASTKSGVIVKTAIGIVICVSISLSIAGLASHRYGYLEDQATCWFVPTNDGSWSDDAYHLELVLLYGPIFTCLVLNFVGLAYIWIKLARIRRDNASMDLSKLKSLVLRLSFSPAFLTIHCLLVVGGDLPIYYSTREAQFTSYICNYIGFSAYALALVLCAIFFDPALSTIMERNISLTSRSQTGNTVNTIQPRSGRGTSIVMVPSTQADFVDIEAKAPIRRESIVEFNPILYIAPN